MADVPELEALAPIVGRAWTCGDRVGVTDLGTLTADTRGPTPDTQGLGPRFAPGDVIVAGAEFGIGLTSAASVERLKTVGVAAVIARSFAPPCLRVAIDAGLPALVIEEIGAIKLGDRLRVDLEQHKIANLSSGDRYIIRNLWDETLDVLRAGGRSAYVALRGAVAGD